MIVSRDFNALLIPSGMPIIIAAGTIFEVTQFKGNIATIYVDGNLVRVARKDLDAIGIQSETIHEDLDPNSSTSNPNNNNILDKKITGQIDIDLVWQALKMCYDPEIPVNIVELGLVYGCHVMDNKVVVDLTLTAPMCGMGPTLIEDVKDIILEVPNVLEVETNMVFDPPWTMERLSEAAKIELGLI